MEDTWDNCQEAVTRITQVSASAVCHALPTGHYIAEYERHGRVSKASPRDPTLEKLVEVIASVFSFRSACFAIRHPEAERLRELRAYLGDLERRLTNASA